MQWTIFASILVSSKHMIFFNDFQKKFKIFNVTWLLWFLIWMFTNRIIKRYVYAEAELHRYKVCLSAYYWYFLIWYIIKKNLNDTKARQGKIQYKLNIAINMTHTDLSVSQHLVNIQEGTINIYCYYKSWKEKIVFI